MYDSVEQLLIYKYIEISNKWNSEVNWYVSMI